MATMPTSPSLSAANRNVIPRAMLTNPLMAVCASTVALSGRVGSATLTPSQSRLKCAPQATETRIAEATMGSMPSAMAGLAIKVPSAWHSAATSPSAIPMRGWPRVVSQAWSSVLRWPNAMAIMTPEMVRPVPIMVWVAMRSPKTTKPRSALNTALVANRMPARRGPRRFIAENRAVSPTNMPIKPLIAIAPMCASAVA